MARRERMNEDELAALIDGQIADAREYARNDLSSDRDKALEFVRGIVDVQAEQGRSSVTSRDLSDVLNWILPALLRLFLASERVVIYEPNKQAIGPDGTDISKKRADQATDYVNYCFMAECDGYRVLQSSMYDGLLLGNGLIKHWWDETPEYKVEHFTGLTEADYNFLVQHEDVEKVLEHSTYPAPADPAYPIPGGAGQPLGHDPVGLSVAPPDAGGQVAYPNAGPSGGAPQGMSAAGAPGAIQAPAPPGFPILPAVPSLLHDCKLKRRVSGGRLRIEALPPEQFLIEREAKCVDETVRFCAHVYQETRSQLIKMGYDRTEIEDLGAGSNNFEDQATQQARDDSALPIRMHDGPDKSTELVDVYECYVLVDYDGDGVAERRKVVMGGGTGQRNVLSNEEWPDDLPFSDLAPEPVPHRWKGRSLFDEVYDVQRIKTVLWRQTFDNLYQVNNPLTEVLDGAVLNMDALINRVLGGNVFVKQASAIRTIEVPFTAKESFAMLEYLDQVLERRTGVSRATMALDMDALQNQTATAVNAATTAAASKSEFYARNIAEIGLKRLFRCLLRLISAHQDRPKMIRLRGEWVEMDPRAWDADMDVSINTGLGSGSRDRDLAMLQGITAKQELILQTMGPQNPIVGLDKYRNTLAKMTEAAGLRGPDQFFNEVTPEVLQQYAQMQAQQPDPKMQEAQARMQLESAKAQHDAQLRQQQAIADFQHKQQDAAARLEHDREKAAADMQLQRDKTAAQLQADAQKHALELQLMREKAAQEAQLKREELVLEAQLKREQMAIEARQAQAANIQQARPQ